MVTRFRPFLWAFVLIIWLTLPTPGWGAERERFQIITGVSYSEGDFGTAINSQTLFIPFTFRYLGDRFDIGLTIPLVYQLSSESVTIINGRPVRVSDDPVSNILELLAPGVGDLALKGRLYLFDDPGIDSFLPAITPFARVKFPTADASEGLGTGEYDFGFGLGLDKQIYDFFVFTDFGYTFMGDPPGTNLRDRIAAGSGIGYQFPRSLSASVAFAWSRALVSGTDDPMDIITSVSWRISRTFTWTPFVSAGLTDGSPDFGVGFAISYKFGRF